MQCSAHGMTFYQVSTPRFACKNLPRNNTDLCRICFANQIFEQHHVSKKLSVLQLYTVFALRYRAFLTFGVG